MSCSKVAAVDMLNVPRYLIQENPKKPDSFSVAGTLSNALFNTGGLLPKLKEMGANCAIHFLSWFDLSCVYSRDLMENDTLINPQAFSEFVKKIYGQVSAGKHESTDHLIIQLVLSFSDESIFKMCFLSFENSVRSSNSGVDISTRIPNFLDLFRRLKEHGAHMIFLCEAGRDVFEGPVKFDSNTREPITPVLRKWQNVVDEIQEKTGWKQVALAMNNDETKAKGEVLSFGIAAFLWESNRPEVEIKTHCVRPKGSFGSGFLELVVKGIRMLFVHFPLDFKKREESSFTDMCKLMNEFHQKTPVDLIIGDFNTIMAGFNRYNVLKETFSPEFSLILHSTVPSFFSAPCDNEVPKFEVVDDEPVQTKSLRDYMDIE